MNDEYSQRASKPSPTTIDNSSRPSAPLETRVAGNGISDTGSIQSVKPRGTLIAAQESSAPSLANTDTDGLPEHHLSEQVSTKMTPGISAAHPILLEDNEPVIKQEVTGAPVIQSPSAGMDVEAAHFLTISTSAACVSDYLKLSICHVFQDISANDLNALRVVVKTWLDKVSFTDEADNFSLAAVHEHGQLEGDVALLSIDPKQLNQLVIIISDAMLALFATICPGFAEAAGRDEIFFFAAGDGAAYKTARENEKGR